MSTLLKFSRANGLQCYRPLLLQQHIDQYSSHLSSKRTAFSLLRDLVNPHRCTILVTMEAAESIVEVVLSIC